MLKSKQTSCGGAKKEDDGWAVILLRERSYVFCSKIKSVSKSNE